MSKVKRRLTKSLKDVQESLTYLASGIEKLDRKLDEKLSRIRLLKALLPDAGAPKRARSK